MNIYTYNTYIYIYKYKYVSHICLFPKNIMLICFITFSPKKAHSQTARNFHHHFTPRTCDIQPVQLKLLSGHPRLWRFGPGWRANQSSWQSRRIGRSSKTAREKNQQKHPESTTPPKFKPTGWKPTCTFTSFLMTSPSLNRGWGGGVGCNVNCTTVVVVKLKTQEKNRNWRFRANITTTVAAILHGNYQWFWGHHRK